MAYNIKYQQKAYIIIMLLLWNDLTNNILLKMGSLLSW